MNSFQLLTVWMLGVAAVAGGLWLLVRTVRRIQSRTSPANRHTYQIAGSVVEICVGDGCSLDDLRALLESIRDDPALPSPVHVLCDSSARRETLTDADVRIRLAVFLDVLRPRMVPVMAVVPSSAITSSAKAAQRYAAAAGIRIELFQDHAGARRWLCHAAHA